MCITNKHGFPIRHRERKKTFFGFQTGDMVLAKLPKGKFAGSHVGRLTVRKSGVFEMNTYIGEQSDPDGFRRRGTANPEGKVSPVRYKYCKAIHRFGRLYVLVFHRCPQRRRLDAIRSRLSFSGHAYRKPKFPKKVVKLYLYRKPINANFITAE